MKLHISSQLLQKKLPFIQHAISAKNQLPVLLHFLLQTEENHFKIKATDLEIGIEAVIPAEVEEQGGITVSAKVFSELIASLPSEKITIQTKDNVLEVISKKTKSVFQTIKAEEFPKLYEEKGEEIFVIPQKTKHTYFEKVAFAASYDTERPALSAVFLKQEKESSILVATDGYRLSLSTLPSDIKKKTKEGEKPFLIPARVIKELILLKDDSSKISLFVSSTSNQVMFVKEDITLIGRLIEADFPNYEKIIPSDFETQVFFSKEELQKAVKLCSIFARETANIVRFSLQKDKIVVSANTPAVGENTVEVEARVKGEENEIAFNGRYVLDLLSHIEEEEMVFEMTGPLNPGVFKISGDDSFLHLIMPIRVQG